MANARDYKSFLAGNIYHIYNRGNNKSPIFYDHQDYMIFLSRAKIILAIEHKKFSNHRIRIIPLPEHSMHVLTFCLMPNHFHFLIKQLDTIKISTFMHKLCTSYSKYFNAKYNKVGNVFQDVFKAKHLNTDEYLSQVVRYIIQNPLSFIDYPYSSLYEVQRKLEYPLTNFKSILELMDMSETEFITYTTKVTKAHNNLDFTE